MKSYVNATRFNSIVTIRIDSVDNVDFMLEVGSPGSFEKFKAKPNVYYDIFVAAGCELCLINNTKVELQ